MSAAIYQLSYPAISSANSQAPPASNASARSWRVRRPTGLALLSNRLGVRLFHCLAPQSPIGSWAEGFCGAAARRPCPLPCPFATWRPSERRPSSIPRSPGVNFACIFVLQIPARPRSESFRNGAELGQTNLKNFRQAPAGIEPATFRLQGGCSAN